MARVTVERTLDKVDSRFELVVLTAYRAHAIYCGSQTLVNANDKYAILALREVESGKLARITVRSTSKVIVGTPAEIERMLSEAPAGMYRS